MNLEILKTELALAEDAELQSDEQLRKLTSLIETASSPNPTINASDCAKLVAASLSLNERLRDRTKALRVALERATPEARKA